MNGQVASASRRQGLRLLCALSSVALISCGGAGSADEVAAPGAAPQAGPRAHALAAAATAPGRTVYPTDLFDWAEKQYPQFFPSHEANRQLAPYTYRYYAGSGNYVGLSGDTIYVLGPISGGALQPVGSAASFLCLVYAQECSQAPVALASDLQTRQLAGRAADALFVYDALSFEIINGVFNALWGGLDMALTVSPLVAGTRALPCKAGGSGQATVVDADGSRTLSVGDRIVVSATNCKLDDGTGPLFTGTLEITVADGDNMAAHWNDGAHGAIELRLDYRGVQTDFGSLSGNYRFRSEWLTGQAGTVATSNFDQLVASGADDTSIVLTDVKLSFGDPGDDTSTTLTAASGAVTTTIFRLGTVRNELSVVKPVLASIKTLRYRPLNGVLRLSGKGYNIDLAYGAARAVTISVDNASDGSVDRVLNTTEDDLDAVIRGF